MSNQREIVTFLKDGIRDFININGIFILRINPVTGCIEHPKSNPFEGMTEEQKEYEALKLVNLVDKLTR